MSQLDHRDCSRLRASEGGGLLAGAGHMPRWLALPFDWSAGRLFPSWGCRSLPRYSHFLVYRRRRIRGDRVPREPHGLLDRPRETPAAAASTGARYTRRTGRNRVPPMWWRHARADSQAGSLAGTSVLGVHPLSTMSGNSAAQVAVASRFLVQLSGMHFPLSARGAAR